MAFVVNYIEADGSSKTELGLQSLAAARFLAQDAVYAGTAVRAEVRDHKDKLVSHHVRTRRIPKRAGGKSVPATL